MIYNDPKDWKPKKYISACCGSIYGSRWAGDFNTCKCGQSSVDDTPYYGRVIGLFPKCEWDGFPRKGKVYYDPKYDEVFIGIGTIESWDFISIGENREKIVIEPLEDQVIELGDL
jgi:hypothetical protein